MTPVVSLTLAKILPPVPQVVIWQIGINDTSAKFVTGVNDTRGKQWEQYQTADNLKWMWRKKFIYMLIYLYYTKVSKKIMKTFLTEDFFHLPPVSMTPVVHLELRISPQIFEKKFETALMK